MALITLIASGQMGSALSIPAADCGNRMNLVGSPLDREIIDSLQKNRYHPTLKRTLPDNIKAFQIEDIEQALQGADLIISGVSSFGVDWFADEILPILPFRTPVLSVTKGLNVDSDGYLIHFLQIFEQERPDLPYAAIGGPCTSYELADKRHSMVYYCAEDLRVAEFAKSLLKTSYYHIITTNDVASIEYYAAMKNAYAAGVALAIGMAEKENEDKGDINANLHYNPQAALFAQSCTEMRKIAKSFGADPDLASGLPAAGDLFVTIFGGRTRRLGTLLGRGKTYTQAKEILEGITLEATAIIKVLAASLKIRAQKNEVNLKEFPLIMHLDALLKGCKKSKLNWESFGK